MIPFLGACSLAALLFTYLPSLDITAVSKRSSNPTASDLVIDTSSGKVKGFYNDTVNDVRAFLGVPFAAAPTGSLRFMPPAKRPRSTQTIDATSWPPACPGLYPNITTIYTILPYLPFTKQDEDCLSLNIWTPSTKRLENIGNKLLPVVVYIYGGAFDQGASSTSIYEGTDLVANHDILFVAINYRVTIFGNPNSPYLASNGGALNVGLLDQRFAIEWLKSNIAAFGGDPVRMIALGQSAGSIGADFFQYAYPEDPIIKGIGGLSGTPLIPIFLDGIAQGNFTDLASAVGCATQDSTDEEIFKCMQTIPFTTLTSYINNHPEKGYLFHILSDNTTAFTDLPERIALGELRSLPMFIGVLDHEGDSLIPFNYDGINQTAADELSNAFLVCPLSQESELRVSAKLPTWRYRYSGIYPNLSPFPFIRSYHTSDVPMWLGSINVVPGLANATTKAQRRQSTYMQGALVAFAHDPERGLQKYGWPSYEGRGGGKTLVHLDPKNSGEVVVLETPTEFDSPCDLGNS